MAVLRALHGENPGQFIPVEGDSAVLGRHPDCDIVLESGSVSRQHARLSMTGENYYIEDLDSRNGTFVNGRAVIDRQMLFDADQLGICDLAFVFHVEPPIAEQPFPEERAETESEATFLVVDDQRTAASSTFMSKLDVSTGSSGLKLEINPQAKLKALMEILRNLGKTLGLEEVLSKLLGSLFTVFIQADRGFVVLKDPVSGQLIPKAIRYRREGQEETARISRTIVHEAMTSREAILSDDAADDSRFDMAESIVDLHIRSLMCVPLIDGEGNALGVIQIDTLDQRSRFSREDLDVLASVACPAAFAVENAQLHETALREQALARELAVAHEVQRGFLPAGRPRIDQYEFFDHYHPARELGGDYFDYIQLPPGRLGVVVADVSGKGIAASLLMAKLSAETRFSLVSEPSLGAAVGRLNRVFCGAGWEDRFVTLVACVLDPARHEVTIVNAGHMPPLLRRGASDVVEVAKSETRLPLGVKQDEDYPEHRMVLQPDECLTLYTDGITEAMNNANELYGSERLWEQVGSANQGVVATGQAILEAVKRFVGTRPQSDDMCLACFGRQQMSTVRRGN